MKNNRPLIRRTFLQERFDVLIKKQREGSATFKDLTELDWIVNRDPAIRESILDEMQGIEHPPVDQDENRERFVINRPQPAPTGWFNRLKELLNKLFAQKNVLAES